MLNLLQSQQFIISCSLSILGILITVCYPTIIKKYRQIAYTVKTTKISFKNTNETSNLQLSYNDRLLSELSYTDLIIWCKGKEMIDASDVAPAAPFTISVSKGIEILDRQIIMQNEPANNFRLRMDGHNIIVNFDYLNRKNGAVIRITHTGNNESISASCKLKEGRKTLYVGERKGFLYKIFESKRLKSILSHKLISFTAILFTIFFFPLAFVQSGNYSGNNLLNLPDDNIFMNLDSLIILILCIVSAILAAPHFYNLFKADPPKDLQNYDAVRGD